MSILGFKYIIRENYVYLDLMMGFGNPFKSLEGGGGGGGGSGSIFIAKNEIYTKIAFRKWYHMLY